MGPTRHKRFYKKIVSLNLSNREEWDEITQFLKRELQLSQMLIAKYTSRQPLCSIIEPEMPGRENPETVENTVDYGWNKGHTNVSIGDKFKATCGICGKTDHKSYVSPFSGQRKINYLARNNFFAMSPIERCKILDEKGLCRKCLTANATRGHEHCHDAYICRHFSRIPGIFS